MACKYSGLGAFLTHSRTDVVVVVVAVSVAEEVALLTGGLPARAWTERKWWSNDPGAPQACGWSRAGFVVQEVDLRAGRVTFASVSPGPAAGPVVGDGHALS